MLVYAGIDEAGYGPMFGPLVIARSVFTVEGEAGQNGGGSGVSGGDALAADRPPCLWRVLNKAVCRKVTDKRKRIAVNDSKKLFTPAAGLGALERGVLAFARLNGHEPDTLDQLLGAVGIDERCRVPDLLWYQDADGGPVLPTTWTTDQLRITRARLLRCAEPLGVGVPDLRAAVVYEDRFNELLDTTRSKARCAWTFVSRHLWSIWRGYGEHHPWVVVDRQGGRRVYHELLGLMFEGANVRLLDESEDVSRYVVSDGDRAMTISFEVDADSAHLPAALASMTAKYVRELLMSRFNRFWSTQGAELRPTAGYFKDGRRFLRDIDPLIDRLGIDRRTLVRSL